MTVKEIIISNMDLLMTEKLTVQGKAKELYSGIAYEIPSTLLDLEVDTFGHNFINIKDSSYIRDSRHAEFIIKRFMERS